MDWEEKLIKAVRETMQGFWPGHDFFHIQRVYNLCLKLGKKLNADLEILKAFEVEIPSKKNLLMVKSI